MGLHEARTLTVEHSVRERLKDILRQYELRERHFECVIRSKELEVLLSRARAAEQKQLAEGEKLRAEKLEEEARLSPPSPS
jgi:Myosin-like coiled-coil protein